MGRQAGVPVLSARRRRDRPLQVAPAAARAILSLLPLDTFVAEPLLRMEVVGSPDEVTPVQRELAEIATELEGREVAMGSLERFAFYERSRGAFATVITGEDAPYAWFLLIKGVIA